MVGGRRDGGQPVRPLSEEIDSLTFRSLASLPFEGLKKLR